MNNSRPFGHSPDPMNQGLQQRDYEMCLIKMETEPSTDARSNNLIDGANDNLAISIDNNLGGNESNNGTVINPSNTTNKWGRKKKSTSSITSINCDLNVSSNDNEVSTISEKGAREVQVPRSKRGRKMKVTGKLSSDNPAESVTVTDGDYSKINPEDDDAKPGPLKGKQGRKKKTTLVVSGENALAPNEDDEDVVTTLKRKAVAAILNSEDSGDDDPALEAPKRNQTLRKAAASMLYDDNYCENSSIQLEVSKESKSRGRASTSFHNTENCDHVSSRVSRSKRKKTAQDPNSDWDGIQESAISLVMKVEEESENCELLMPAKHGPKQGPKRGPKTPAAAPLISVKCASCQKEMLKNEFSKHNIDSHNNLAWVEGEEPIDLNDEKLVNKLLKHALTKGKRKKLVCELCGAEKKSAVGFVGHKRFCGKTAEEQENLLVTCELCGRKVKPVSVKAHMSIHERPEKVHDNFARMSCPEESGRKRAAATKAKSKMMEFLHDEDPLSLTRKKRLLYSSPNDKKRAPTMVIAQWKVDLQADKPAICINTDCSFEATSLPTIKKHYFTCEFAEKVQGFYSCSLCVFKCEDEPGIEEHIATTHPGSNGIKSGQDSGSDDDIELEEESHSEDFESDDDKRPSNRTQSLYLRTRKLCHKYRFLAIEDPGRSGLLETYTPTLMWTLKYRVENDSYSLFSDFHCTTRDWELINGAEIRRYLPAATTSAYTSFGDTQAGKRFSLFESQVIDDTSIMFVGGPVWSCAWCPLPLNVSVLAEMQLSQFLAVSCHREMDEHHTVYPCYVGPNVIQIWDCGALTNSQTPQEARLALAIAHEYGTVWRMEWCPSGAYGCCEPGTLLRMGLLAAACSDGCVHIFSVCFPNQLQAHEQAKGAPVYRAEPVLTLRSNSPDPSQCTRLSWYRGKGHGLIAGGFCDGKVTLWNLENFSTLLFDKENRELYPYHTFQAHLSVVSALSLSPDGQYLMTGSHDCSVKFWDLDDTTAALTMNRKGIVTDGVWLSHWVAGMASYDDAFLHEHTNATVVPVRDFGFKPLPAIPQNSVGWCLSESAWLNSVVQGTQAGEVALNIAGQLFTGLDNDKNVVRKRLMVSFTELRDLIKDSDKGETLGPAVKPKGTSKTAAKSSKPKPEADAPEAPRQPGTSKAFVQSDGSDAHEDVNTIVFDVNPEDYKDTSEKYGINIVNILKFKADSVPAEATKPMRQSNFMHPVHSDKYPITSVNQVQWNPHLKSCLWLAIGHHSGLLRLVCLSYMHTVPLDRFISKAEALLEKTGKLNNFPSEHT